MEKKCHCLILIKLSFNYSFFYKMLIEKHRVLSMIILLLYILFSLSQNGPHFLKGPLLRMISVPSWLWR